MSRGSNGSRKSKSEPSTVEDSPRTSKRRTEIRGPPRKPKEVEPKRRPATEMEPMKKPRKRKEPEPQRKPQQSERRKSKDVRDLELEALMEGSRQRPREPVPVEGEEDPTEVCKRDNKENCKLCPKDNEVSKLEEVKTANEAFKDRVPEEATPTPKVMEEVMQELKEEEREKEVEPQDENVAPKKTDEEPQVYYLDTKGGFRRALEQQYRGISLKAKDSFILHKTRKGEQKKDRKKVREEKIYYVTDHEPNTIEILKKALPPSGYLCIESQPSTFSFISEPSDWDLPSDCTLPPPNKPPIDIEQITKNMKTHVLNEIQKSWDDYIANLIKKI